MIYYDEEHFSKTCNCNIPEAWVYVDSRGFEHRFDTKAEAEEAESKEEALS